MELGICLLDLDSAAYDAGHREAEIFSLDSHRKTRDSNSKVNSLRSHGVSLISKNLTIFLYHLM